MNLLFIWTDEQRYDTLAAYGNHKIKAPNLDRLAAESILFERAYVTQPICTPSRSSVMTGLYPRTNGCTINNVPLSAEFRTLVECDDFSEYRKCYIGKWHLGDEIFCQHGFDEWISTEDMYRSHYSPGRDSEAHCSYYHWLMEKGYSPQTTDTGFQCFPRMMAARMPEEHCKPSFQAEEACRFLADNRDNPFVLYVNFLEPHMPFFGPRDDMYDREEVDLPPNFDDKPGDYIPHKTRRYLTKTNKYETFVGTPNPGEAQWRDLIARYWGLVSQMDAAVGRILTALEENGLVDDTIVVFTSDHGDMMGSHRLVTKSVQYEEAVRVPLFIRIPGHSGNGSRVTQPVGQIDLVPTLLDYMGKNRPEELQGYSWRPFLDGTGELSEKNVFVEWSPQGDGGESNEDHSIRTVITPEGWKFNWRLYSEHELYNLGEDPVESRNLFRQETYLEKARELAALIRSWQKRTADALQLPEF